MNVTIITRGRSAIWYFKLECKSVLIKVTLESFDLCSLIYCTKLLINDQ